MNSSFTNNVTMWSVYIILCQDGSLYTGCSNNPSKRFEKHVSGKGAKYTRSHKPDKIVYLEECGDRSSAAKRESEIKSWPREKKIKVLNIELA